MNPLHVTIYPKCASSRLGFDGVVVHSGSVSDFSECSTAISSSYSPVPLLLRFGGPSAILSAVRAVIVDPIKRVFFGWARPHIAEERSEVCPVATDINSTTAVVGKGSVRISCATRPHGTPCDPLSGSEHPMGGVNLAGPLSRKAPAGCCTTRLHGQSIDSRCVATVADAIPSGFFPDVFGAFFHNQPAESTPCKVYKSSPHDVNPMRMCKHII